MTLDHTAFLVHDIQAFPLVRFRHEAAIPGYAPAWEADMQALMRHGEAFVVVFDGARRDEAHDDRKARGLWLKRNKAALGQVCRGLLVIEADAGHRETRRAAMQGAIKAFGIRQEMAGSWPEAQDIARRWLAGEAD
ncbi:hypothetical protein [Pseudomonas sp. RIT-PI-AD]|uniref:hypothetical protein n=1 Tax=Pseudomonas sp. RIT-PI-AD TaxID=3035294 RepID=UPI0021D9EB5F|nr:hypothetical protein [Pseudomonas sp. RIT-PI-AD]